MRSDIVFEEISSLQDIDFFIASHLQKNMFSWQIDFRKISSKFSGHFSYFWPKNAKIDDFRNFQKMPEFAILDHKNASGSDFWKVAHIALLDPKTATGRDFLKMKKVIHSSISGPSF